ncbi:MAG: ABC transporter permease [Veillonella sp.]|nr:ABC transporter permease [Veillonella sp.]
MLDLVVGTITTGLLWSLLAVGVFITFRVLDVADLTVEGTFPMGAAISAILITSGMNPILSILIAGIGGMALYSINLHIMGKANVSLLRMDTIYTIIGSVLHTANMWSAAIVGIIVAVVVCLLLFWFFGTEIGTALRATGVNPQMIRAQGVNTDNMIVLGLLISNGFVGMSGALIGQFQGFADVGMGIGTIVIGLASVIIGEVVFGTKSFVRSLIAVVLGSIVYRIVIAAVLYMGMPPNDLKLFTAILVAIALSLPTLKAKWLAR